MEKEFDKNKVWARPIDRKKDYYPVNKDGKLVKGFTLRNNMPLAAGTTLDGWLRAFSPSSSRKQREVIAKMIGLGLRHRIYVKYTSNYLSIQRHKIDTTIIYMKDKRNHSIGEVVTLSIEESKRLRKQDAKKE